ncbi:MAG: glycosyltransferase [Marmoricola sp.]
MAASDQGNRSRYSVVVPTYQRRDLVTRVVEALSEQSEPPLEVLVVVDGSTDGSAAALRALTTPFPLHVLEQANAGASRARNRGAAEAKGNLLLFLDDDMLAAPDLLQRLGMAHAGGASAVLGHIPVAADATTSFLARGLADWADRRRLRLLETGGTLTAGDLLTGQLSVRREVFESLGGFDEQFTKDGAFGGEDTDFGRRLFDAGHRVVFAPDAIAHQWYTVTPDAYLRQWHQAGAADVRYLRKHPADFDEVFAAKRPDTRSNRLLVRPLSRVPVVRDAVAGLARPLALALAERRPEDRRTPRVFFKVRNLEYWRGVESAGGFPACRPFRVLCYHAVRNLDGTRISAYGVPAEQLRRQLRLLRWAGYRFVTLDEALRAVRGERGVPRRSVLVTFDDCYTDLLGAGVSVLRDEGVPAAAFAVAGRVGASNTWDVAIGAPELPLLDAEGLRSLQAAGLAVGAHGSTHVPLTAISGDAVRLVEETDGARRALSRLGIDDVRAFAYPHGEHDERSRTAVANAGLEAAFTVMPGVVRPGTDPLRLPRVEVLRGDGSGLRFLVKVWSAGRLPAPGPQLARVRRRIWRRVGRRPAGLHRR